MIDHLRDLESDFSRFHGVRDIYRLDGPRFMAMAWRISMYGGVMARRLELQQQRQRPAAAAAPTPPPRAALRTPAGAKAMGAAQFTAAHSDLVDRRRVA